MITLAVLGIAGFFKYFAGSEKLDTKKLCKALIADLKSFRQLEELLINLQDEPFKYKLRLKNSIQNYSGTGTMELRSYARKVLPSLHGIPIENITDKDFFTSLLKSTENEEREKQQKQYDILIAKENFLGLGIIKIFFKSNNILIVHHGYLIFKNKYLSKLHYEYYYTVFFSNFDQQKIGVKVIEHIFLMQ